MKRLMHSALRRATRLTFEFETLCFFFIDKYDIKDKIRCLGYLIFLGRRRLRPFILRRFWSIVNVRIKKVGKSFILF